MKIKKYDRFKREGQIIEATGIQFINPPKTLYVFKVLITKEQYDPLLYTAERLIDFGFKKIPRSSYPHPQLSEINDELKADPAYGEDLIKFAVAAVRLMPEEEENKFFVWIKKHIPIEWQKRLEEMPLLASEG